jgi:hypothetical protein
MIRLPKWILVVLAVAVLVGLAGAALAAEETAKGKIKKVTADKKEFVITDNNGKDWTFTTDKDAKIRLADKESKLDDLKEGDEVEVKYEKKGDQMVAKEVTAKRK